MAQLIKNVSHYKLAILWAVFFSINSLGAVLLAALTNVEWTRLTEQDKILLYIGVFVSWSNTMMAFLSRVVHRLTENKPIIDNPV